MTLVLPLRSVKPWISAAFCCGTGLARAASTYMKAHFLPCVLASFAIACGDARTGSRDEPTPASGGSANASGGPGAVTWCSTAMTRDGVIAGTSIDYPTTPDTTWFKTSLEELALSPIDEEVMKEVGLSPGDEADVERFQYFSHGFDL